MNREVKGGGGIKPDIETKPEKIPLFISALWKHGVFLSFSSQYIAKNNISENIEITDEIVDDFKDFFYEIKDEINYKLPGEKELESMKGKLLGDVSPKTSLFSIFKRPSEATRLINRMERFYKKKKSMQFPGSLKYQQHSYSL